jgi:hypothetical protein
MGKDFDGLVGCKVVKTRQYVLDAQGSERRRKKDMIARERWPYMEV